MIFENQYWKDPLIRDAKLINSLASKEKCTEDELGLLERSIMVGFFGIRKLFEARAKLSVSTMNLRIPITRFEFKGDRMPDLMNRHHVARFYDLEKPVSISKDLGYLSNQMVHSFVFEFRHNETSEIEGVFFSSDWDKAKFCNLIEIQAIAHLFETVGNDYPSRLEMKRKESGEWQVLKSE